MTASAATGTGPETVITNEAAQTKEKYASASLTHRSEEKTMQVNLAAEQRRTHRLREGAYGCQASEAGRRQSGSLGQTHLYCSVLKG